MTRQDISTELQELAQYGNYEWFYKTYKAIQDPNSDLALTLVTGDYIDPVCSVSLVIPQMAKFYTDQEPKLRALILSWTSQVKTPEQVTKETILNIKPEVLNLLGSEVQQQVNQFITDETVTLIQNKVRDYYAKEA